MIDIPGIYVGRFKDDPNQSTMLMQIGDTPTYTDDNWANVESTGTIWRYNAKAGEWVDTGLEEILVEEVSGTKEIVAEGTVPWKLQGLNVYGKSTQVTTTGAQLFDISTAIPAADAYGLHISILGDVVNINGTVADSPQNPLTFRLLRVPELFPDGSIIQAFDLTAIGATFIRFRLPNSETDPYIVIMFDADNGDAVDVKFRLMVSSETPTEYEPYTGGQPSPSPDYPQEIVTAGSDGTIDISVANSDGTESQTLTFNTPNGLPGIPVDSGGNFTDADGQQWVCDEVDFENGVYVQYINKVVVDGTNVKFSSASSGMYWNLPDRSAPNILGIRNQFLNAYFPKDCFSYNETYEFIWTKLEYMAPYFETIEELNAFCAQKNTEGNPLTIMYAMDTPIENPLDPEELAAYAALRSYDDRTIISTDEDISGMSAKVVTDVISKNAWFDPYAELALYYKALAGFASLEDLPMPHSRESSLVRKLLDSSYELGFSVNENSSRNERYLWDLINGTSTMLTNVPKSDTEKFLHVMIGGSVEVYPTVDTELDYWMDKCVHYMSSNGNIGG